MEEPTVADMSIADEHIVVTKKTRISAVCEELSVNPGHAVLVKKGGDILGVVTAKDIFATMAEGTNATKVKVEKIMRTDIMSLPGNMPLSLALGSMSTHNPDAIIITDSSGDFLGYFSAHDYREATRKLEAHELMAARLNRSRNAISQKAIESEADESGADLLGLLLGGFEDEDEDIVEDEDVVDDEYVVEVKELPSLDFD